MTGIAGSVSGAPLAQAKGSDIERTGQDAAAQQRVVETQQKAEAAGGVGEPDMEDHQTADRDADGRLPWQRPSAQQAAAKPGDAPPSPPPKDPTGQSGNLLDLSG
jgi:hypothetical protein